MSASAVASTVLVAAGTLVEVIAVIGALFLRTTLDRAHVLGPATILGPLFIVAGIVVHEQVSSLGIKALVVLVALWLANPVLGHATARAAVLRGQRTGERVHGAPEVDV